MMSSVEKLETMLLMKFSRMMTARMAFQSVAFSPSSRQMDSSATLTMAGGLPMERTSTRCCFLMDFTAVYRSAAVRHPPSESERVQKERNKRPLALRHAAGGAYSALSRRLVTVAVSVPYTITVRTYVRTYVSLS